MPRSPVMPKASFRIQARQAILVFRFPFPEFAGLFCSPAFYMARGVRKSRDHGMTWETAGWDRSRYAFSSFAMTSSGCIYAGDKSRDMYCSDNAGRYWESCGLSGWRVRSLFVDARDQIYAGTTIVYRLPQPGFVSLKIYDLSGREIAALVNRQQNAGIPLIGIPRRCRAAYTCVESLQGTIFQL